MNIKRAVTHPSAHSFASIRRDWRKPPGAGNRWRLVLHQLPKQKKSTKQKKKTKRRRKHFVPFSVTPASRCDLLPPTAYVSRSPGGVSRSAAKSCRGGHSLVSGSLPLRNWGQPLSSVDLGGAEVQRSAGERQEGRHSPRVHSLPAPPVVSDLLHKRLCLQPQSGGRG